jgi:membrane protein YdbS with pleckstrin-like domain
MSGEQNVVRLREPKNSVDRRAISWWTVQAVLEVAPVVLALAVLALLLPAARPWLLAGLAVAVLVGVPYVLIMPRWRFRVHRWEATDDAVFARSGWLWQEWRVAPMSRIQTVDTVRGPLQQRFRLSTLTVTTASAKGAITIDGLDHELAADLVIRLTAIAQANPGDAT